MKKIAFFLSVILIFSGQFPGSLRAEEKKSMPSSAEAPVIKTIEPNSGFNNTSALVTIKGANFDSTCRVYIGAGGTYIAGGFYMPEISKAQITSLHDVYVQGNYAYLACDNDGLRILDISDKSKLKIAGGIDTKGCSNGIYVSGDHAYIADGEAGLQIVDIKNPAEPAITGNIDTPGEAISVYVSGDYTFIADGRAGLQIINITYPDDQAIVGSIDTPGEALNIFVSGNYAYVADGEAGLQIVDVSELFNPKIISNIKFSGQSSVKSIYVLDGYAYAAVDNKSAGSSGLRIVDVGNPEKPKETGTFYTGEFYTQDVYVKGDYAYCGAGYGGLKIINVKDKKNPLLVNSVNAALVRNICASDNYVYITGAVFEIVDITNNLNPCIIGNAGTYSYARDVYVSGNYAYLMDDNSGLCIIDIINPVKPTLAGKTDEPKNSNRIFILNNYAYIAAGKSGLYIIDINDAKHPAIAGKVDTPDYALDVFVSGDYAYVAAGKSGLQIVDIKNPGKPVITGGINTPGEASGIYIAENYVYLADGSAGLQIIDISDRSKPVIAGSLSTFFANKAGISVSGNYLYIAEMIRVSGYYMLGLKVIDIHDKAHPKITGSIITPSFQHCTDLFVSGNYAYLTDSGIGIQVIDINDPANPVLVNAIVPPAKANGIYVSEEYIYAAAEKYGLWVYDKLSAGVKCEPPGLTDGNAFIATIPKGLMPGKYNIKAVNPFNAGSISRNSYTVLPSD